ncbi:uncharacterized protein F4807DRAFT_142060 [Annulohypoxylon truncatum]|uniref:uncharacterized protein n=1 Tax=Annulohypoxylon truncatum TaxID=327061 RepID=UPI0020077EEC|nr:uncharacterized protein F4807DRAFT_142060 [Annulohypoxylon truncatum]KAI1208589.1 hypothetical protein F4807DRAFT_142060 [Annulohypoxylon truncatum]
MPDIDPMLEGTKTEPGVRNDAVDTPQQYSMPTAEEQDGATTSNSHPDQQQSQPEDIDASTTLHQDARPSITSTEELRLAAQLSQEMSQGMPTVPIESREESDLRNALMQSASHEAQLQQQQQQQQQQHDSLPQDQIPEHNNHIHEQHPEHLPHDDPSMNAHDPSVVHHEHPLQHDQQPQHQYIPNHHPQEHQQIHLAPQQPHMQQHPQLQPQGTMEQLAQHYAAQASAMPDIPPRKRSKVSRACDECRRKKVKCDAALESGENPCSNCRRSQIHCLFSRIPQKRGPSKGYIKELADRINHIEGKLASDGGNMDRSNVDTLTELLNGARRDSMDIFSPTGQAEDNSRKRPYSSISGGEFATPTSSRQATWSSEPRPIQPYQTPSGSFRTPYSANGLAPQPLSKPDSTVASRPATAVDNMPLDLNQNGSTRELDEAAFSAYLNVVHPCFPLLAASKARAEGQLAQCPPPLRDAFVEALYLSMQSFVSVPGLYTTADIGSVTRMIAEWESDSTPRTPVMNLVHLQTLILTALMTDNYDVPSLKGEHGGPAKASILGRAVGLAYTMRLHVSGLETTLDGQLEPDSSENIAIRAWWTLIMLDRWNAISTASPLFIPNDSVVILPSLSSVLGDNVYHLARLSNILGHFAPVSLVSPKVLSPDSGAAPILSSFFNLSMELFREILPQSISPTTHPILHMVYWHCRLLAYLFQTNAKSTDILWPCKEAVTLLLTNTQLLSPLNHHFFCLTTLSLIELAKVEKTRDEATGLLKQLLDANLAPSTWDGVIRDRISDHLRPSTAQAAANQSLQHLADLATATEVDTAKPDKSLEPTSLRTSDNYSDVGFDPRTLTRNGYLNVLAGIHMR